MPLTWERSIPEVKALLAEIDSAFPQWNNVTEQLLVLRECNYSLQDALSFGEENFGWKVEGADGGHAVNEHKMRRHNSRMSNRRRSQHSVTSMSSISSIDELIASTSTSTVSASPSAGDLGPLSAAAASRLDELDSEVVRLRRDNARLTSEHEDSGGRVRIQSARQDRVRDRQEKRYEQAQSQITELQTTLKRHREQSALLERDLIIAQTQAERAGELEHALAAKGADKSLKDQLDAAHSEVVALKTKLSQTVGVAGLGNKVVQVANKVRTELTLAQKARNELELQFGAFRDDMEDMLRAATRSSLAITARAQSDMDAITMKYRAEVLQRKLLYNKIQELRGNIRVFMRCRNDPSVPLVIRFPSATEVQLDALVGGEVLLDFDQVYAPKATQEQLFEGVEPTIMSCVDGYNVCIIAYGQTGSGKTYTMMGTDAQPGVNRRAIRELLKLIETSTDLEVEMEGSIMEVYNENVYDLLDPTREKLNIRQAPHGVYVENLASRLVASEADLNHIIAEGDKNRTTASTKMNTTSSRSHLILQLDVEAGRNQFYWFSPRICSRTLLGYSDPSVFSQDGSLLPSSYADTHAPLY